jgi:DUF971 family protein
MKTASGDPALHGLAAILLRDSCGCAECRDSGSGQRLGGITDLPADVSVVETRTAGNSVTVVFGPDGHRAVFSRAWLAEQHSPPEDDRVEDAKRLWAAGDLGGLPEQRWPGYLADEGCRERCLAAFYAAYRAFAEMVTRPDLMLTFRLEPGDCVVFDNTRILHARTGFAATGRRHLQGCYADLDGVASTVAVLRRKREATG